MDRKGMTGQRLAAVFLLGCVLLNYPLLFLFNRPVRLFGIPLLYLYVFAAWAGLIALLAYLIEHAIDFFAQRLLNGFGGRRE